MKLLSLLLAPLLLFAQEPMQTRTQVLMGTFVSISLPQADNDKITRSFELIRTIERALSTYDPDAALSILNKNHHVKADPYLAEAISLSKTYHTETDGYFDVTIGSISKALYHFGEEKTYSPSKAQLRSAKLNIDGIHTSETKITSDEGIIVDLGGMGKGYAVDKAAKYLAGLNISQGIIALSGDIQCLHRCELYLQSPFSENTFAKIESGIQNLSISTSGIYRRYATKKSEHHLLNPKTAMQGKAFVSVSLFAQGDNSKIDAFATAVSVMPKEKALEFLKRHREIGYVLVEPDGNVIFGNLERFVKVVWEKGSP